MTYQRTGALLGKKFREYLFPTIISNMSILLASFVDGIIVSKLINDDAFSAVNLAEPVVLFMQALFFLFGIGGAICISIAKGQRNTKKANALFSLSLIGSLVVSVVVTVAGVLLIDPVTSALCTEPQLTGLVRNYSLVTIIGTPLMVIVPYLTFVIRVDGLPKLSANILLASNAVNLLMDFVYIGVFGMDTSGAALATVTGYGVGFLIELYYLIFYKKRTLRFVRLCKDDLRYLGELCSSGISSVLSTVLLFVKAILLNRIVVATGGADAIAVFSVCNFTVTFISMFISGGADTMTPIISLLYGEQDHKGTDIVLKKTLLFVCTSCLLITAAVTAFPQMLLMLFSVTSPERVEMGTAAVRIFSLCFVFMGLCNIIMNYLQASRHRALSLMVAFLRGIVIIVPLAYGLSLVSGVTGIWWSFMISEMLTAVTALLVCFIISRVRKNKYTGILLHERQKAVNAVFDVSLFPDKAQASAVSKELTDFCTEHKVESGRATLAGLLAEEIVENIRFFNKDKKQPQIDLICHITDNGIIISVRDNGDTFDSITVDDNCGEFTNLRMIHSIADKVSYSRTLGMNTMLVQISDNA